MTENGGSPAHHAIVELLHELCATANTGRSLLGASLDGAVVAARDAVRTWSSRVEELAAQSRARDDAMLLERRARDQVCSILDLIMQLATLPDQQTTDAQPHTAARESADEP